jgi:hypothetical protein
MQRTNYRAGDIVRITVVNGWTLGHYHGNRSRHFLPLNWLRECPTPMSELYHTDFDKHYTSFEGELALLLKITRNLLDQPTGYQVQIGQNIMLCKSVIAEKYFELAGDKNNVAGRGASKV